MVAETTQKGLVLVMCEKKDALWIRQKLDREEFLYGSHVFCGAPMLSEAIALAGYDMVWLDMEHTAIDKEGVLNNLIALRAGNSASLVRIAWNDPVLAKPILDMGPDALLFPYIRTVEDAKLAIASCTYPPRGIRGYGPLRALEYGKLTPMEYVDTVNKHMLRFLQLEHIDAVENLDAILDVEGVDGFIVGPNDLAGSVGLMGRPLDPAMESIYDKIGQKLTKAGRPFGVSVGYDEANLKRWIDRGARILFSGHDSGFVYSGAKAVLDGLQSITASR